MQEGANSEVEQCRTHNPNDGHFAYWSFRLRDISPTGQFAHWTLRLLDISPTAWTVHLQIALHFINETTKIK